MLPLFFGEGGELDFKAVIDIPDAYKPFQFLLLLIYLRLLPCMKKGRLALPLTLLASVEATTYVVLNVRQYVISWLSSIFSLLAKQTFVYCKYNGYLDLRRGRDKPKSPALFAVPRHCAPPIVGVHTVCSCMSRKVVQAGGSMVNACPWKSRDTPWSCP